MRRQAQEEYAEYVSGRLTALRELAFLLCGDEHRADDIVQSTIEKLYLRWARISSVEHVDAYVRQMLVRTFLDERRRPWSRVGLTGSTAAAPEPPPGPGEDVEGALVLRAALAKVPGGSRRCWCCGISATCRWTRPRRSWPAHRGRSRARPPVA